MTLYPSDFPNLEPPSPRIYDTDHVWFWRYAIWRNKRNQTYRSNIYKIFLSTSVKECFAFLGFFLWFIYTFVSVKYFQSFPASWFCCLLMSAISWINYCLRSDAVSCFSSNKEFRSPLENLKTYFLSGINRCWKCRG